MGDLHHDHGGRESGSGGSSSVPMENTIFSLSWTVWVCVWKYLLLQIDTTLCKYISLLLTWLTSSSTCLLVDVHLLLSRSPSSLLPDVVNTVEHVRSLLSNKSTTRPYPSPALPLPPLPLLLYTSSTSFVFHLPSYSSSLPHITPSTLDMQTFALQAVSAASAFIASSSPLGAHPTCPASPHFSLSLSSTDHRQHGDASDCC
jgi:hypothetical protein